MRTTNNDKMHRINQSIRRIHFFPNNRQSVAQNNQNHQTAARVSEVLPTLIKCPKTLAVLWQEWEFGINGRKAAKDFNSRERGNVRFTYHRRKVFWDKVAELIRAGYTAHLAIDKIYSVYPNKSVTQIINAMRKDRKTGGHEQLRV